MDVDEFARTTGIGIGRYGGNLSIQTRLINESQQDAPDSSQERTSKAQQLHVAKKTVDIINDNRKTAETVTSHAELELLKARKIVRELSSQIQHSRFKLEQKIYENQNSSYTENHEYRAVVRQVDSLKRVLSKIKLDMARALEEKSRAQNEEIAAGMRLRSYTGIVQELRTEIEDANEEEVLVELAQIQARKELAAIQERRKEDGEKFSSKLREVRKKINALRNEVEQAKRLKEVIAITNAEAEVLQNELKFIKEMDGMSERKDNVPLKSSEFQSVTKDLEAAKKQYESIKAQVFEVMTSMDLTRIELNDVLESKSQMQKAEAKTEKYMKKLNSKLLRSKDKLEAAMVAEEKAKLMLPTFILSLEELVKVKEAAQSEKTSIMEETKSIKDDIQNTESMTDLTEERLQAAMQELKAIKTAEESALENLKTVVENVAVGRAYKDTNNITISKFEYDYITGHAKGADEIAEKKMAAALAWADALRANANEMQIKTALAKKEMEELRLKEEQGLSKMDIPLDNREVAELEPIDKEDKSVHGRKSGVENSYSWTPARQTKFRKSIGSPAARRPIISTSLSLKRKRMVMRKFANYFVNKETENEKVSQDKSH